MRTHIVLALAVFAMIAQAAFAKSDPDLPDVELEGNSSYHIDCPNDSITVGIDSVMNFKNERTSSNLTYCLVLTEEPYKPSDKITGWPIFEASLDPLPAGKQYANISTTKKIGKEPKTGKYYVTILLLEERYVQKGFCNYVVFSDPIDFKNTKEDAIKAKMAELNEAQRKYDYYTMRSQSSDIDTMTGNTMQAMNMVTTIASLKMELYYLGYNTENPAESTYIDSPRTYKSYCLLVDERPSTTTPIPAPAYAPTPAYTPGNGQQRASSSGSRSNSMMDGPLRDAQESLANAKIKLSKDQTQYDLDSVKYEGDLYILDSEIEQIQEDKKQIIFYEDLIYKISSHCGPRAGLTIKAHTQKF